MTNKKLNITESITPTLESPHISKSIKEIARDKLNEFMKEELKMVKGRFQCFETPGSSQKIIVRKYAGHFFEKEMVDGETYEIPLYVARHLNGIDVTAGALSDLKEKNTDIGTCSYSVHGFKFKLGSDLPPSTIGAGGIPVPIVGVVKRTRRYGFQSTEFLAA